MTSQNEQQASDLHGHLPECEAYRNEVGGGCICHHVRACEQRVRQETFDADWSEMGQLAAVRLFRKQAYVAGLDAAREAVERVSSLLQPLGPALAAIDALRDQPADQTGYKPPDAP